MNRADLEELEAVEVWWVDAHGGAFSTTDWTKLEERHTKPEVIRTVGLLVHISEDGVLVALSYTTRKSSDAYIFIPNGCITELSYLEERE
jgi:hypothetical protein